MRCATSRWNISVNPVSPAPAGSQSTRSRDAIPYGRLATTRTGGSPRSSNWRRRASAWITDNRPWAAATRSCRATTQRASRSTATTRRAPASSSARVKAPGPGPISTTVPVERSPAVRAMRAATFRSNRKCWPNDLRGAMPAAATTSRIGGRAAMTASVLATGQRRRSIRALARSCRISVRSVVRALRRKTSSSACRRSAASLSGTVTARRSSNWIR